MDALTIRTKFKNLVAQQVYNKNWGELSIPQQNDLRSKHRQQFYILSRKATREMSNEFTKEDRELLIRVDERSERVERWCYNHDSHHFRFMLLAWGVALSAIITLAIALIKVL